MSRVLTILPVILLSFLAACGNDEPAVKEVLRPVRYAKVYSGDGGRQRTFSGKARSGVEAKLSFKVAGTLLEIPVKVGDKVRKGQLIAKLDDKDYRLQVQQADAAHSQTAAALQKARSDYERLRALYENNNASKSDLDAARAAFESGEAAVRSADKQRELARLQWSYTSLRAPSDGSIASVGAEVSENVQAGRIMVMMMSGSNIEVDIAIPEMLIAKIEKGSRVKVKFDAIPGKDYDGIIREVGVTSTDFATTYPVTVQLADKDVQIRSGMAAEVTFNFQHDLSEQIIVPSFAVRQDREGTFVFVVEPLNGDTAVTRRVTVQIGDLTGDGVEILSGLSDGDLVVTAGVSKISHGQKVRL